MKVTVRVDVERHVRDESARQHFSAQGLTIDDTARIVLESASAGCGPDLGALVPSATTMEAVEAVEAAQGGEVVELGTPADVIADFTRAIEE